MEQNKVEHIIFTPEFETILVVSIAIIVLLLAAFGTYIMSKDKTLNNN